MIAAFAAFARTDRDAGEWVIRKGGRVMVNGGRRKAFGPKFAITVKAPKTQISSLNNFPYLLYMLYN